MNKKAELTLGIIGSCLLVFILAIILVGIAYTYISSGSNNIFSGLTDTLKNGLNSIGINLFPEEEAVEEAKLESLPEDYQTILSGLYDAIQTAKSSTQANCIIKYPPTTDKLLAPKAIILERGTADERGMKIRYLDENGRKVSIKELEPIEGLEPCFVAGKNADDVVVAKNLYENLFSGSGEKKKPEYIEGNVRIYSKYYAVCLMGCKPNEMRVDGKSDVPAGTVFYNHFMLYKADESHVCLMPEIPLKTHVGGLERGYMCEDVKGDEGGLYSKCFEVINEKIPECTISEGTEAATAEPASTAKLCCKPKTGTEFTVETGTESKTFAISSDAEFIIPPEGKYTDPMGYDLIYVEYAVKTAKDEGIIIKISNSETYEIYWRFVSKDGTIEALLMDDEGRKIDLFKERQPLIICDCKEVCDDATEIEDTGGAC